MARVLTQKKVIKFNKLSLKKKGQIGNEIKNIEEMKNKEKEIIKKVKKDKKKQEAKKQ